MGQCTIDIQLNYSVVVAGIYQQGCQHDIWVSSIIFANHAEVWAARVGAANISFH